MMLIKIDISRSASREWLGSSAAFIMIYICCSYCLDFLMFPIICPLSTRLSTESASEPSPSYVQVSAPDVANIQPIGDGGT